MLNWKQMVRKILSSFGYEIRRSSTRSSTPDVTFDNFANIAVAYEQHLNNGREVIQPNEKRLQLLARLIGTPPTEAYAIIQALARCKDIPGDVCEFGVAQGATSALIANEIVSLTDKRLHLFDSFEGLPKPSEQDRLKDDIFALGSMEAYTGQMSCPEDMVRTRLEAISFPQQRYVIHKGFIERILHEDTNLPTQVSFAYVDFDFYEPIKVTLEFLHAITRTGAVIIVDDYDFFSTGAKTAVDEFIEGKNSGAEVYECFIPDQTVGHFAVLTKKR